MEVKAQLNHLRIAPRKVRLAANLLKGKRVSEAQSILLHLSKRSSQPLLKLLKSAVANAKHNFDSAEDSLTVKNISVNKGFVLKRFRPRAFGRAAPLHKETSHVSLVLGIEKERDHSKFGFKKAESKKGPTVREVDLEDIKNNMELKNRGAADDKNETRFKTKPVDFVRRVFRRKAI